MEVMGRTHPEIVERTLSPAPDEPVTVAEAKLHCAVDGTTLDTKFAMFVSAARAQVEHMTSRSIKRAAYTLSHAAWLDLDERGIFSRELVLPRGPVLEIGEVRYRQTSDGAHVTLASDQYILKKLANGRSIFRPAFNVTLPTLHSAGSFDNVEIDYIAGAAAGTPTVVDERLRLAIMMIVSYYNEHRENTNWDIPSALASSVRGLTHQLDLTPY